MINKKAIAQINTNMEGFKNFLENKTDEEALASIKKLPKSHQKLVKDYKFKFENGCNLKGYPDSIGLIHIGNDDKKLVRISAPWRHSREFAVLHEIGHLVWQHVLDNKSKSEWKDLIKNHRKKLHKDAAKEKNEEELFCHHYAQHYCQNKVIRYNHDKLDDFIEKL